MDLTELPARDAELARGESRGRLQGIACAYERAAQDVLAVRLSRFPTIA